MEMIKMEEKDKQFRVWFKTSPIFAKDKEDASKKAYDYMDKLPDDWIEIDDIIEEYV